MKVVNVTKGTILAEDLKEAVSFLDRALGLLRKSNPQSLSFQTRFGIHTFGLKSPIDVLVLDNDFNAVKTKTSLLPNRLFFWNPRYSKVLELPEGTIEKTLTKVSDRFKIEV